ncbi:MAG TPA: hypothetical protein VMT74_01620 [Gaiellaceae bacterium]|nr:hypothetical protein [Gaiellaceae bacterium]
MTAQVLVYLGSTVLALWGVTHLIPTRTIVRSFGAISRDNALVLTMEWVAEGVTHLFVALLAVLVTAIAGADASASIVVYRTAAGFLVAIAALTTVTGARTPGVWYRICPVLLCSVAVLYVIASVV